MIVKMLLPFSLHGRDTRQSLVSIQTLYNFIFELSDHQWLMPDSEGGSKISEDGLIFVIKFKPHKTLTLNQEGPLASMHDGLMISAMVSSRIERSEFFPSQGRCVLGKDTLLSQYLSPATCINGYRQTQCWCKPCDSFQSGGGGGGE